jgi:hypothetical protein
MIRGRVAQLALASSFAVGATVLMHTLSNAMGTDMGWVLAVGAIAVCVAALVLASAMAEDDWGILQCYQDQLWRDRVRTELLDGRHPRAPGGRAALVLGRAVLEHVQVRCHYLYWAGIPFIRAMDILLPTKRTWCEFRYSFRPGRWGAEPELRARMDLAGPRRRGGRAAEVRWTGPGARRAGGSARLNERLARLGLRRLEVRPDRRGGRVVIAFPWEIMMREPRKYIVFRERERTTYEHLPPNEALAVLEGLARHMLGADESARRLEERGAARGGGARRGR